MKIGERTDPKVLQQTIERFWEVIPPVWNTIKGNVRGLAAEQYEISVEQFQFLRMIRRGVVSVSDLAEHKQISRSAVSQAIDLLVEKGLVARKQDAFDRRYVHLALTPAGDEMLNELFRQNRAWMAGRMAHLEDQDLQTIMQAMELLKTAFIDFEQVK
jgi:DNA-binding MarR family transcriptional regulator